MLLFMSSSRNGSSPIETWLEKKKKKSKTQTQNSKRVSKPYLSLFSFIFLIF